MMEGNSKSGGCVLGVTNLDHSLQSPNLTARSHYSFTNSSVLRVVAW